MSGLRHRRDDYDDRDRGRFRERRRSRSRERQSRYRRSDSRSPTRYHSSSRHYQSFNRDSRSSRYTARHHSGSRSRSRSKSPSNSRSYSRTQKRSRTPTNSTSKGRRSRSTENTADVQSRRYKDEDKQRKHEATTAQSNEEQISSNNLFSVENLPLPPKKEPVGAYYNLNTEEPIDKEKIHREMEEKLRAALAKEGKVYPPPKSEASHPVFANDGSFIEIFKKMQQAQQLPTSSASAVITSAETASTSTAAAFVAATSVGKPAPPPPIVGRRRGGKILKTGLVAKPKAQGDDAGDPKDFWSIYLREVNKYKNNACESDGGNRPLVK